MADKKLTEMDESTAPGPLDLVYVLVDPGGAPVDRKSELQDIAGALMGCQLVNEIKGWPPIVNTGDLGTLNLWFDKIGTPSTGPSVVAVTGEAGVTEVFELALKITADAANEGLSQTWTYTDEPRVKNGRRLSTLWAIWCVGGVGVTVKLVNSDASETAAVKVTSAAWTVVEIPNHLLAGTYCDIRLLADGAGTFYAVPLGANIGARGLFLKPRGLRYVEMVQTDLYYADPGGAPFTDVDATALSSPLTAMLNLTTFYTCTPELGTLAMRRNGDASGGFLLSISNSGIAWRENFVMACDDGQIIEFDTDRSAANTEGVRISLNGYWEWE